MKTLGSCGGKCGKKEKIFTRKPVNHITQIPKKVPLICHNAGTRNAAERNH